MEKRKPNDLSLRVLGGRYGIALQAARLRRHTAVQIGDLAHARINHEFSCPLERSASKGILVRDLMLTEPCPFRAQQHTKHREVSAYAKS